MSIKQYSNVYKIILVGSSCVGKSNIILRYTQNNFSEDHQMTFGIQFASKNININNKIIKLEVWDTLGQEQYKSIMKTFYKGVSAVILTFSIVDWCSFNDLQYWLKQISNALVIVEEYTKTGVVIILVGVLQSRKVNNSQKATRQAITKYQQRVVRTSRQYLQRLVKVVRQYYIELQEISKKKQQSNIDQKKKSFSQRQSDIEPFNKNFYQNQVLFKNCCILI